MKTASCRGRFAGNWFNQRRGRLLGCFVLGLAATGMVGFALHKREGFVAHEWGTFTSVQGGDGVLLDWRPLQSAELPKFVYDWKRPGLNRQGTSASVLTKGAMVTLQRMETPVIYFYADKPSRVDVSVSFPQGLITEWYPQATQIGPATVPASAAVAKLDTYAHKAGTKPDFTFASWFGQPSLKDSRARWANLEILPEKENAGLKDSLPVDRSGSHYFAARATDASYLQMDSLVATNNLPEHEKFIFYRGVGNFTTPLRLTMTADGVLTVTNTGAEPLAHLFVLSIKDQAGGFFELENLRPGEQQSFPIEVSARPVPLGELSGQIGERMANSLVKEGLYRREATAMVDTWKDSWFQEEGVRVLYVLPREWTDRTLPMKMEPAPRELTRVMVGRAEVLTPTAEGHLSTMLTQAGRGNWAARTEAFAEFKKLGRFAQPAFRLAMVGSDPQTSVTALEIFRAATAGQSL